MYSPPFQVIQIGELTGFQVEKKSYLPTQRKLSQQQTPTPIRNQEILASASCFFLLPFAFERRLMRRCNKTKPCTAVDECQVRQVTEGLYTHTTANKTHLLPPHLPHLFFFTFWLIWPSPDARWRVAVEGPLDTIAVMMEYVGEEEERRKRNVH